MPSVDVRCELSGAFCPGHSLFFWLCWPLRCVDKSGCACSGPSPPATGGLVVRFYLDPPARFLLASFRDSIKMGGRVCSGLPPSAVGRFYLDPALLLWGNPNIIIWQTSVMLPIFSPPTPSHNRYSAPSRCNAQLEVAILAQASYPQLSGHFSAKLCDAPPPPAADHHFPGLLNSAGQGEIGEESVQGAAPPRSSRPPGDAALGAVTAPPLLVDAAAWCNVYVTGLPAGITRGQGSLGERLPCDTPRNTRIANPDAPLYFG